MSMHDLSGLQCFPYSVIQIAHFKYMYFQVQTHVQTAHETPDLNMDLCSFDNG